MKRLVFIAVAFFSCLSMAADKEDTFKHWYIGIGPAFSNALVGGDKTGGTKYDIAVGYEQGLAERIDLVYFFDGSYNTATQGSTGISELGAQINIFAKDRGADASVFLDLDLGYGGGNRFIDDSALGGFGIGYQFFRNKENCFEVLVRHNTVLTQATTNTGAFPSVDQVRFAVRF